MRRVRVTFRPKEIGLFNHELLLENLYDTNNFEIIKIEAAIRAVQRAESLTISELMLNYGDCYSGIAYPQKIKLKNVSDRRIDVHFATDIPDQVFFELKTEPIVEVYDELPLSSNDSSAVSSRASSPQPLEAEVCVILFFFFSLDDGCLRQLMRNCFSDCRSSRN